jgi:hypothetical protein
MGPRVVDGEMRERGVVWVEDDLAHADSRSLRISEDRIGNGADIPGQGPGRVSASVVL